LPAWTAALQRRIGGVDVGAPQLVDANPKCARASIKQLNNYMKVNSQLPPFKGATAHEKVLSLRGFAFDHPYDSNK
jgi:hypothetical protein